jgi:hypothetical protein
MPQPIKQPSDTTSLLGCVASSRQTVFRALQAGPERMVLSRHSLHAELENLRSAGARIIGNEINVLLGQPQGSAYGSASKQATSFDLQSATSWLERFACHLKSKM